MHKRWILPICNKRHLGSTWGVLSANRWIAINVINGCIVVNTPVFQHLTTQPMKPSVYSKKQLPTLPLAECFRILRSLSDFLFINEVFGFLFRSSYDVFRLIERDRWSYYPDTASSTDAADADSISRVGASCGCACLPQWMQTTNEALPHWSCCHHWAGGGGSTSVSVMRRSFLDGLQCRHVCRDY